jgi:hypothetical protein
MTVRRLNYRKERGRREAGILPTELLPLTRHTKSNMSSDLQATPKFASLRTPDSTVSRTWHSIKNDLRHADELAQNENGQYATSAAAHLKLLIGERHVSLMFTPPFSISK